MKMEENLQESALSSKNEATSPSKTKRVHVFSAYVLPSDRYPFPVHLEILKRYVTLARTTPLPAEKVEGPGIPKQSAGMNVRFMGNIGLLKSEKRGEYSPAEQTIAFIYARTADENKAKAILRQILQDKWFAQAALKHLMINPITTREQLLNGLALVAQTDRQVKGPSLEVLVDYLVYAGIITEDEQGIRAGMPFQIGTPQSSDALSSVVGPAPAVAAPGETSSIASETKSLIEPATSDGWQVIQTEDYSVKVRSDLDVIADLRDAIDLLEKKARRVKEKRAQRSDLSKRAEITDKEPQEGDV